MTHSRFRRIGGFLVKWAGKLVSAALLAAAVLILMLDLVMYLARAEKGSPTVQHIADEMQLIVLAAAASLNLVKFSPIALAVEYVAIAVETALVGALVAAAGKSPEQLLRFMLSGQDWSSFEIFTWESWNLVWPAHLLALTFYLLRISFGEFAKEISHG